MLRRISILALCCVSSLVLCGCPDRSEPGLGDGIKEAVEEVKDEARDAVEEVKDEVDDISR